MLSFKAISGYLAFALAAVVFFLYVLFPEDAVRAYLDSRVAAMDPQLTIGTAAIRPSIPPGLNISGMDIIQDGVRLLRVDNVRVRPELTSLFDDEKRFQLNASLAGGRIIGQGSIAGNGAGGLTQLSADLDAIRIEQIDAAKRLERFSPKGMLSGHVTRGEGRAKDGLSGIITTSGLTIKLANPMFGIADIQVATSNTEFSIDGRTVRLKSLTFDGPMVEGRIGGTIELRQPLAQSRLNLTGNAKPQPDLLARLQETIPQGLLNPRTLGTRGLTFRVRGTIDSPDLSTR